MIAEGQAEHWECFVVQSAGYGRKITEASADVQQSPPRAGDGTNCFGVANGIVAVFRENSGSLGSSLMGGSVEPRFRQTAMNRE